MSSRRTVILIAAIVVGALAAVALLSYVRGIEGRANEKAQRVKVFKIAEPIPKGTFGDEAFRQGWIVEAQIPKEFFPATAITSETAIADQVAISNLAANQVVVGDQFVPQAKALTSFSDLLEVDDSQDPSTQRVAITVSVDQVRGVAGLLVPGDFVNLLIVDSGATNAQLGQEDSNEQPPGGEGDEGQGAEPSGTREAGDSSGLITAPSRYLYQKVQILAIGQQRVLEPGETVATDVEGNQVTTTSGLVTFSVTAESAQRIASVAPESIYLTLVAKDYEPFPLPPLDLADPVPGESADQLTPYGPEGPTAG